MATKKAIAALKVTVTAVADSPVLFALLSHPKVPEVRSRLVAGASVVEVAEYVQKELKLFDDLDAETMVGAIQQFRDGIPAWEFQVKGTDFVPAPGEEHPDDARIDVVNEMQALWRTQKGRIDRSVVLETAAGKIDPLLGKEIERGRETLKALTVLYTNPALASLSGKEKADETSAVSNGDIYGTPEVKDALSLPETRRKVLLAAEGLLGIAARRLRAKNKTGEAPAIIDAPGEAVPPSGPHGPPT